MYSFTLFHFRRLLCAAHTCGVVVIAVTTSRPVVASSLFKSEGCDELLRTSVAVSGRCNCWVRMFVFQFSNPHGSWNGFSSRGDHSIRFAPIASLEGYHASQAEVRVVSQVTDAEACRHQEDAPRESDHRGERRRRRFQMRSAASFNAV